MKGNREYKSDVFFMLLEEKANALEIYNALNDSDYSNPDEVEIIQLEKGVSLSIRNDASFIIDMNMSLYEHQSSYNKNMPLRSMIYFVNALEDWLKENEKDLFSRNRILIPTPHFVVFYNGVEHRPEYEEMRLSQSFYHPTEEPQIELICKVYNINPNNNQELKRKSPVLDGYTYFVEKVRDNQTKDMNLKEAVADAIEDCIKNHILEDFFISRKDEVKKMTHLDYTWAVREKLIRKEEYADGKADGKIEAKVESIFELLEDKGDIPKELRTKIAAEKDLQVLTKWHKAAAKSDSIDEFIRKMINL